jgi:3-hydroxybutyryl-CoA dehydrogenase
MATGVAHEAALHGYEVVLCGRSEDSVQRAHDRISASFRKLRESGEITEEAAARIGSISLATSTDAAGKASIVVESVVEDINVKREIFRELDRLCEDALLLTNTSAISVGRIAEATTRPHRVAGAHFFAPVQKTRLCEITRAAATSEDTITRACAFATGIGKACIVVERDIPGMVTTRLMMALGLAAIRLLESGIASAEDIDSACRLAFGHPMGPLSTADLSGIDVLKNVAETLYEQTLNPEYQVPELVNKMIDEGHLGRKSGRGFHAYR